MGDVQYTVPARGGSNTHSRSNWEQPPRCRDRISLDYNIPSNNNNNEGREGTIKSSDFPESNQGHFDFHNLYSQTLYQLS
jgi:hypothetical protein